MSGQSPASVLYSSDGYELAVVGGAPFELGTRSIIAAGFDGANTQMILTDISGRQIIVGAGTAGSPSGGVVSIQGVVGGTVVPISGTVNQGSPNTLINAWPVELTDGYGNLFGEPNNPIYVTGNISATNPSVGLDGSTALGFDTQIGGIVSTNNPTYTAGNLNALSLDTSGRLRVSALTNKASTSAITSVAGSTSNTQILASNANRIFASIYNGTNKNMYVKLGTSASTSSYSILLITGSYWEIPNDWTGEIDAVWAGGVSGNALVTELTP